MVCRWIPLVGADSVEFLQPTGTTGHRMAYRPFADICIGLRTTGTYTQF